MQTPTRKEYISADRIEKDAWRFALDLHRRGERFDALIGVARGGAQIAIYMQEVFSLLWGRAVPYCIVHAQSYSGVGTAGDVAVADLAPVTAVVRPGQRVLLVDDVFDRGQTLKAVRDAVRERFGESDITLALAALYRKPANVEVDIQLDFCYRDFPARTWLVFPHELLDLSPGERLQKGFPPEPCFDALIDRRDTDSFKWDRYGDRDVIPLWVADMDFRSPPCVAEALHRRVEHGVFGYTRTPPELVQCVLDMLQREYDWSAHPEWLVWLPGLVTGLNVACRAGAGKGDAILTATPVYPPFLSAPELAGCALSAVPLAMDGARWVMDFDALRAAMTPATRLFLLCNPQNPTGRAYSREELTTLAALCETHDLTICSDEIHCGLVLEEGLRHTPIAALSPEIADRAITLMAPSKTFNIPGLGCSFAVIPNASLRERFERAMAGIVPHVNAMGYVAALAAYRDGGPWHAALIERLRENRDLVDRAVGGMPGLRMTHVEATYLAWIDARELCVDRPDRFFEEAGVGLFDGAPFGGPGFVRLNFGCPRATLERALDRMRRACESPASR